MRDVILLCAVNVIGEIIVYRDAIELRGGLNLLAPILAAIETDIRAAVVGVNHPLIVIGRDPQIVIVAVRFGN